MEIGTALDIDAGTCGLWRETSPVRCLAMGLVNLTLAACDSTGWDVEILAQDLAAHGETGSAGAGLLEPLLRLPVVWWSESVSRNQWQIRAWDRAFAGDCFHGFVPRSTTPRFRVSPSLDAPIWLMGKYNRVSSDLRETNPQLDQVEDEVPARLELDPEMATVKSHGRDGGRYFHIFGERVSTRIDDPHRPKVRLTLSERIQGGNARRTGRPLSPPSAGSGRPSRCDP